MKTDADLEKHGVRVMNAVGAMVRAILDEDDNRLIGKIHEVCHPKTIYEDIVNAQSRLKDILVAVTKRADYLFPCQIWESLVYISFNKVVSTVSYRDTYANSKMCQRVKCLGCKDTFKML